MDEFMERHNMVEILGVIIVILGVIYWAFNNYPGYRSSTPTNQTEISQEQTEVSQEYGEQERDGDISTHHYL